MLVIVLDDSPSISPFPGDFGAFSFALFRFILLGDTATERVMTPTVGNSFTVSTLTGYWSL